MMIKTSFVTSVANLDNEKLVTLLIQSEQINISVCMLVWWTLTINVCSLKNVLNNVSMKHLKIEGFTL